MNLSLVPLSFNIPLHHWSECNFFITCWRIKLAQMGVPGTLLLLLWGVPLLSSPYLSPPTLPACCVRGGKGGSVYPHRWTLLCLGGAHISIYPPNYSLVALCRCWVHALCSLGSFFLSFLVWEPVWRCILSSVVLVGTSSLLAKNCLN